MPSQQAELRRQENHKFRAKAPLAAQFDDCLQDSDRLKVALQDNRSHSKKLRDLALLVNNRLKTWGDQSGASSRLLDYALKCVPTAAQRTSSLLTELRKAVHRADSFVRRQVYDTEDLKDTHVASQLGPNGDAEACPDDPDADYSLETQLNSALDVLDCLVQLLPILIAPLDEDSDQSIVQEELDLYSESGYARTATELFPKASKVLRERLGKLNWRRRQHLRRLRHERAVVATPVTGLGSLNSHHSSIGNPTWPSGPRTAITTVTSPQTVIYLRQPSGPSIWTDSSSVTPSTAQSHAESNDISDRHSTISTNESQPPSIIHRLVPPDPPVDLESMTYFDCPCCHFELPLTVSNAGMTELEWLEHFYLDLKPYSCTFDNCEWGSTMFGTSKDWLQHELAFHRTETVWSCCFCHRDSGTQEALIEHLQSSHSAHIPANIVPLLDVCRRYSTNEPSRVCQICSLQFSTLTALEDHVADHLEKFALAATLDLDAVPLDDNSTSYNLVLQEYLEDLQLENLPASDAQVDDDEDMPAADVETLQPAPTAPPSNVDAGGVTKVVESDASVYESLDKEVGVERDAPLSVKEKVEKFLSREPDPNSKADRWSNVPARDNDFLGRGLDLGKMHAALGLTAGQICLVTGRGGIGKSAIAIEYVHLNEKHYYYIFWVEAESPGICQEKYNQIASSLDTDDMPIQDERVRTVLVRECLGRLDRNWLLVFDNVNDWQDIEQYVPKNLHKKGKGSVLITSRKPVEIPSSHHHVTVALEPWSLDHSRQFLLTQLSPKLKPDQLHEHEEYHLADKVVNVVERLPLAVCMIVGYIKISRATLEEFLEMWDERMARSNKPSRNKAPEVKFGNAAPGPGIDKTIDILWDVGIREVRANCRKLLDVFSFLDAETIPQSVLLGSHDEKYLEFLHEDETIQYKRMIKELARQRLVTVKKIENGEEAYSIHRVLQHRIQADMDDYSFADAFQKAFRLIRKRFRPAHPMQIPEPESMDIWRKYMPHIYSFHQVYKKHYPGHRRVPMEGVNLRELAELFYDAAFYVWGGVGTAYDGLPFLKSAEKILDEENVDPNDRIRADIHCITGLLLLNMGSSDRVVANDRLRKAWEIRKNVLDACRNKVNDVLYQNATNDWCICLMNLYQFDEAGKLIQGCLEVYKTWGSEEDEPFEYAKYYGNYSVVLMWQNKTDEAVASLERSLVLTEMFTGGKKSQYYRRMFFLACVHLQAGNLQKAFDLHYEVLKARLALHGQHHESSILSMYAMGAMHQYTGDIGNAIKHIQTAIKTAQSNNWAAEALARARYHLALLYEERDGKQGDEAKALMAEARKVLETHKRWSPEVVRDAGDDMLILDDMQGTFTGRYTGRGLLMYLQEKAREGAVLDGY